MLCPSCQKLIATESKFCQHCGTALTGEPAPANDNATARQPHLDPASEKPIREFRPAWRGYLGEWALWVVLSAFLFGAMIAWGKERVEWKWVLLAVFGGALIVFVRQCIAVYNIRYKLTTQRLFVIRGILSRTTDQLELLRVDDVRVRQSIIERMFNIGSVELITSDPTDRDLIVRKIDAPAEVGEEVRRYTRKIRGRQTLYVENTGGDASGPPAPSS